jgi:GTPase
MLIDNIKISVSGGKGGDGVAVFSKEMMKLGPDGGNGGKGGDIIVEGVSDIGALRQFRYKKIFKSFNGKSGRGNCRAGSGGKDIILKVPVGTVIKLLDKNKSEEIISVGQKIVVAVGGKGGRGNFSFRSSTSTSPKQFTLGMPGEEREVEFELKLIADIGIIGLPNAGKSSLLNTLTGAKSRVDNYQFTTLEPHLGSYWGLILADIPGLISGASSGKGLGVKFLRHIERTKIILHLISLESESIEKDYEKIRKELVVYGKNLDKKKEYIVITKSDLYTEKEIKDKTEKIKNKNLFIISIKNKESMASLEEKLQEILRDKND